MRTSTPYQHFAAHYDAIFRLNPALVAFLARELDGLAGRRIVDAGCGTGTLARELALQGAEVLGVDLDPALLAQAAPKALGPPAFRLWEGDLRTFPSEPGLAAVLCLGNTLPHLPSEADVSVFLRHARSLLAGDGALVLQLVNYGSPLAGLPTLETEDWRFERAYAPLPDGRLRFTTRFTWKATGEATASDQPLLPLKAPDLAALLARAGFHRLRLLGGFDGAPFTEAAPALVVLARP